MYHWYSVWLVTEVGWLPFGVNSSSVYDVSWVSDVVSGGSNDGDGDSVGDIVKYEAPYSTSSVCFRGYYVVFRFFRLVSNKAIWER